MKVCMLKNKGRISFFLLSVFVIASCGTHANDNADVVIQFNPNITYQTIHSFGASDAWSCQFVGKYWPQEKKQQMADWLFSTKLHPDGSPKGIGLSCWRFNMGAGSSYLKNDQGINDKWRKAESFLRGNEFNAQAQLGQRWFLKEAAKNGVHDLIGFVNSPPIALTKNGKAYSSGGSNSNISSGKYNDYANFLCNVYDHLQQADCVTLTHLSPINEPQWDWKDGQEGSPWTNTEMANFARILDAKFTQKNIHVKIELTEAGKLNYLYEPADKPQRGQQIQDFWSPNSSNYIGNLQHLSKTVSGHSYFTTFPNTTLVDTRKKVREEIARFPQLEFGMSEYCMLEDNKEIKGYGKDVGMDAALYMAKVIHADLVEANATTWQWWLAISPYNYKDGLIYIDKDTLDGTYSDSKLLWALGNYSRFIPPGSQRIELDITKGKELVGFDDALLISAYKTSTEIIVVIVNQSSKKVSINTGIHYPIKRAFITNNTSNLELKTVDSQNYEVYAKSVYTLLIDY